jgi:hypothetical protein
MVVDFISNILRLEAPSTIVLDPDKINKRAIRCYEKARFVTRCEINDGSSLLMEFKCPSDNYSEPFNDQFPDRQSI